jgi:hypothetical protein
MSRLWRALKGNKMNLLEEFIDIDAPFDTIDRVMTDEALMRRWMSPAVRFRPSDGGGWGFEEGRRWQLELSGVGPLLRADYVVHARREGLILWAFDGFWEGFDAWHWWRDPREPQRKTIVQNRIEYEIRNPLAQALWTPVGLAMEWDARVQMRRLQEICERHYAGAHAQAQPTAA